MKHIRLFSLFFLVVRLALPLEALACDDLKAIRDAAQQDYDDAQEALRDAVRTALALLWPLTTVPPPGKPGGDRPKDESSGLAAGVIADGLDPLVDAARQTRDKAKIALDSAQFQLDQCLTPEKAACGHRMPGHGRAVFGL